MTKTKNPTVKYIEVRHTTSKGIVYTRFRPVMPAFPKGQNRHERRREAAIIRKNRVQFA